MKKNIVRSALLSVFLVASIVAIDSLLVGSQTSPAHFLAILFFFIIYVFQSLIVKRSVGTPNRFVTIYTFMSAVKMFLSFIFIAIYLAVSKFNEEQNQINFLVYFLIVYFLFLIVNVTATFNKKSGQQE